MRGTSAILLGKGPARCCCGGLPDAINGEDNVGDVGAAGRSARGAMAGSLPLPCFGCWLPRRECMFRWTGCGPCAASSATAGIAAPAKRQWSR